MISIYVWGMDCVTYDSTTNKCQQWSSTCIGELTPTDTKKRYYYNIQKWYCRKAETIEEAKEWMLAYRKAWNSRIYKDIKSIMEK